MSASYRTSGGRFLADRVKRLEHRLVTPEGIPIRLTIGSAGDRVTAFLLDLLIITGLVAALSMVTWFATSGRIDRSWLGAIFIVGAFLIRNFYFIWFELRLQGSTPGKRKLGLRVIDRNGGTLTGEAIFARNLTREIEVFLPLAALANPEMLWPGAHGLAYLLVIVWLVVFALMPLFNRQRLRIGDMVGGTMVVEAPKALLLEDLSSTGSRPAVGREPAYAFSTEQLDVYGIYELQVLEDLLRRDSLDDPDAYAAVCETIKRKIGWDPSRWDVEPEAFLRDFYAAQRARLEHKMLLGKRQEYKKRTSSGRFGRR